MTMLLGLNFSAIAVALCNSHVIRVHNQQEFDTIQESVYRSLKSGNNNIHVEVYGGTYVSKEQHILLESINNPNAKIQFTGHNAKVIPGGFTYHNGDIYQSAFSPNHSWMNGDQDVGLWTDMHFADGLIEILDNEKKTCRLKGDYILSGAKDISFVYIMIPHWFKSSIYKIDRIEGDYLYFTATDLTKGYRKDYNVNDDNNYGNQRIRYRLCNVDLKRPLIKDGIINLPQNLSSVREGTTKCFICIKNCKLHSIKIKGISFLGNSFSNSSAAVYMHNNLCSDVLIRNCVFRGIRGKVISINSTSNVKVINNQFYDCYDYGIYSDNDSRESIIKDNSFERMGKGLLNTYCIRCDGDGFIISGNLLKNYGHGGICSGIWYKNPKHQRCSGIIEDNRLVFTDDYLSNIFNYGLMDGGAIYLATKNDGITIRNNYIKDYSCIHSSRGIFCDDGASNLLITGNLIIGPANEYSIDSRRVAEVEESIVPSSGVENSNLNNSIIGNIIDGRIRFEGNERVKNDCFAGLNYHLVFKDQIAPSSIYHHVSITAEDAYVTCELDRNGKFLLSRYDFNRLRTVKGWRSIKRFFGIQ